MKIRNILLIMLSIMLWTACDSDDPEDISPVIEIPDASFRAYCLENFDTDKDGYITVKEVAGIEEIANKGALQDKS